jgi:hypothetical protein
MSSEVGTDHLSRKAERVTPKLCHSINFNSIFVITRGAEKSLARPTSRYILFDGETISFDANLVLYIYI